MTTGHPASPRLPLVGRAQEALLFRSRDESRTVARFLRDVHRLAADLPEARHVCNMCEDRYHFAVTLAAAALRGQVSLLSSDRSPGALRSLAGRFEGLVSLSDLPGPETPLRHHAVRLARDPAAGGLNTGSLAIPCLPAEQTIAIAFTSGSTGVPVGHRKSWGAVVARSLDAGRRFGLDETAPAGVAGTVPPQHMYGFETTVLLPLHAAASSWSGPAFYPADIRDALAAMPAPRTLVTTPLQLRALLDADAALPPLAGIISATAPLDPALAAAAERRWGGKVREIYGATEVGSIASRRTVEGATWTAYEQVRLVPGTDGQTRVVAPHAEPHPLADIVDMLSPTEFRLVGRAADLVKIGGRRASLAGLNAILLGLPGVTDGAFVAPDDLGQRPGARLLAFAVAPERTPEDLLAELRTRIEPVFLPRRVILAGSLPRNATGKLPRAALLALLPRSEAVP